MAEAAVNFAIETLGPLLVQEIKLLGGVKKEVENIKSELESLRFFLKDADARAAVQELGEVSEDGVGAWVNQLREQAYRIEDVIDEYTLMVAKLPHGSSLVGVLRRISRFIKKLKLRRGVATEIQDIKLSLADIKQRGDSYGFRSTDQGSSSSQTRNAIPHDSRVGSFFLEEDEVVGIGSTRDKLIDLLVNGETQRSVIAAVGEGGLGKTTLAAKIFSNEAIKNHFDCRAWVTVGKYYEKMDLLKTIIQEFQRVTGQSVSGEISNMDEKELITTLREYLKDKTYMIVFDDVWKVEFWGDVEHALLDNKKGSRMFLTTRRMNVAEFCKSSALVQIHELESLPPNETWELFCRKAFGPKSGGYCPSELKELSHDILAKCRGLPLAIVAVGGLLSTKNKDVSEWRKLRDGLGSKLGSDPHLKDCNRVLSEGYYDLPHHLKSCLLYFALFPEGDKIKRSKLMRLWISEGFVRYSKSPTSEQVAQEYLNELIGRSLVQVSQRDILGRAKHCRVHDLMYEILVRKSKELGFCCFLNEEYLSCKTRRISMQKSIDGVLESFKDSKVRSVLLFDVYNMPETFMNTIFSHFKLMKVLDLEDAPIDCLPEGVGDLFHLHYLSARYTKVKIIPKSIGKLSNLETLDLRATLVRELPVEIRNLKKLRYLRVHYLFDSYTRYSCKIEEGIESLTDLQELSFVEVNSQVLKELGKLMQLRKLGIELVEGTDKDLCALTANLGNLECLIISGRSKNEILDIESLASPPQYLQRLELTGKMTKLPDWIFALQNLKVICLYLSGLTDDPLRVLQALPNLLELNLVATNDCESLHFKEGWFPQLHKLILSEYEAVKYVVIEQGAMPNLRELSIQLLPLLMEIPAGIEHLRNLKLLRFYDMMKQVYCMIKDENWEKVTGHIPEIFLNYSKAGKFYAETAKHLMSLSPEELDQLTEE